VGDGSKEDIQGRLGAIFGVVGLQPYVVMLTTMLHCTLPFPVMADPRDPLNHTRVRVVRVVDYTDEEELKVFSREQHDNMVSVLPYFLSMLATSFPFAVIMPIIFSSIYYWMTGLRPEWDAFLWFTLCVLYVHRVVSCRVVSCRVVSCRVCNCGWLTCLFPALRSTWLNRWDSCSSHSRGRLRPLRSRPTPSCPSGIFVREHPPAPLSMHHPHFSLSLIADVFE
jgi:hypothetical protein